EQLLALESFPQYDLLVRVDAADGEGSLGQVDTQADNGHGSPHSLLGRANNLEPARLFRRLHFLRGWSYEEVYKVFARSPRARGAHGIRARERGHIAVGGDRFDRVEDWVHSGDLA